MAEVAFGGRTGHVELGHLAADTLEQMPRVADPAVLIVNAQPERGGRIIGGAQFLSDLIDRAHVLVEGALAVRDRTQERFAPGLRLGQFVPPQFDALFLVTRGLFEPAHLCGDGRCPLDESGVSRARFGRPSGQRLDRLARLEEPALRGPKLLLGGALHLFGPADRRFGL